MNKIILCLLFNLMPLAWLHAEESTFIGRALSETVMEDVTPCPANGICMAIWTQWMVDVERTVRGPTMPTQLIAARLQHGTHIPKYLTDYQCFVVRPIVDETKRRLLGVDYELVMVWKRDDLNKNIACNR